MRHTGGDPADHDDEMEEIRWFPLERAMKRAAYRGEREVLGARRGAPAMTVVESASPSLIGLVSGDPLGAVRGRRRHRDDPGDPGPARHRADRGARDAAAGDPPHGDHRRAAPTGGPGRSTCGPRSWMSVPGIAGGRRSARSLTDVIDTASAARGHARCSWRGRRSGSCAAPTRGRDRRPQRATTAWTYVGIGLAAGLVCGLLGIGGGLVMVPLLAGLARHAAEARARHLAARDRGPRDPGTIVHAALGHIDWAIVAVVDARRRPGRADRRPHRARHPGAHAPPRGRVVPAGRGRRVRRRGGVRAPPVLRGGRYDGPRHDHPHASRAPSSRCSSRPCRGRPARRRRRRAGRRRLARLVAQTPWTTLRRIRSLDGRRCAATNDGRRAARRSAVRHHARPRVRSRTLLRARRSRAGPDPSPCSATTPSKEGALEPGQTAYASTSTLDLATVGGVSTIDSGVYPLQIDLRSGGVPLASLNSGRDPPRPQARAAAPAHVVDRADGAHRLRPRRRLADPGSRPRSRRAARSRRSSTRCCGSRMTRDRTAAFDLVVQPLARSTQLARHGGRLHADGRHRGRPAGTGRRATRPRAAREPARRRAATRRVETVGDARSRRRSCRRMLASGLARDLDHPARSAGTTSTAAMRRPAPASAGDPPAGADALDDADARSARGRGVATRSSATPTRSTAPSSRTGSPAGHRRARRPRRRGPVALVLPDPGVAGAARATDLLGRTRSSRRRWCSASSPRSGRRCPCRSTAPRSAASPSRCPPICPPGSGIRCSTGSPTRRSCGSPRARSSCDQVFPAGRPERARRAHPRPRSRGLRRRDQRARAASGRATTSMLEAEDRRVPDRLRRDLLMRGVRRSTSATRRVRARRGSTRSTRSTERRCSRAPRPTRARASRFDLAGGRRSRSGWATRATAAHRRGRSCSRRSSRSPTAPRRRSSSPARPDRGLPGHGDGRRAEPDRGRDRRGARRPPGISEHDDRRALHGA